MSIEVIKVTLPKQIRRLDQIAKQVRSEWPPPSYEIAGQIEDVATDLIELRSWMEAILLEGMVAT